MSTQALSKDTGLGVSFIVSAVIHLTVFLLLAWYGSHSTPLKIQETYYVDVVNLPVASPRSGSPSQKGNDTRQAPAPPREAKEPMALPAKPMPVAKVTSTKQLKAPLKTKEPAPESAAEFAERMAKMKRTDDARQEEAVMARLREKVKSQGSGRAGMPGASGKEAGSRYEDYIKSRMEDALKKTSNYSTKNPIVVVRITISSKGQVSQTKIESSSGDHTFELAVQRAIEIFGETLYPPPNHKTFENGFTFHPREISKTKP